MKHVKVNCKQADKATAKRGYQHANYSTGYRAMGQARHDNLHPSVRPTPNQATTVPIKPASGASAPTNPVAPNADDSY